MNIKSIHKFGGSSLNNATAFRRVAKLICKEETPCIVVVSAISNTTNLLEKLIETKNKTNILNKIISTQIELIQDIDENCPLIKTISTDKKNIAAMIAQPHISSKTSNLILSYGEFWSSLILNYTIEKTQQHDSHFVDARKFIIAEQEDPIIIDYQQSRTKLLNIYQQTQQAKVIVTTGFICSNNQDETVLLGRNGSDYSATIIAKIANANKVTIWSDVSGIFSTDPNYLLGAKLVNQISIAEANQLAKLGCPMLHEKTIAPILNSTTELRVRSSIEPSDAFTYITQKLPQQQIPVIAFNKEITIYKFASKLNITEVQTKLELAQIYVLGIWQNYQGLIKTACSNKQKQLMQTVLTSLQEQEYIGTITEDLDFSLVALVSNQSNKFKPEFAKIIDKNNQSLFDKKFSLITITATKKLPQLVQAIHQKALKICQEVNLFICGDVDSNQQVLQAIKTNPAIQQNFNIKNYFHITKHQESGFSINNADQELEQCSANNLIATIKQNYYAKEIIIIESSSILTTHQALNALSEGVHVISASNNYFTLPMPLYKHTLELISKRNVHWLLDSNPFTKMTKILNSTQNFCIQIIPKHINNIIKQQPVALDQTNIQSINPFELRKQALSLARQLNFELNIEEITIDLNISEHELQDNQEGKQKIQAYLSQIQAASNQKYMINIVQKNNLLTANVGLFEVAADTSNSEADLILIQQEQMQLTMHMHSKRNTIANIKKILKSTY